MKSYRTTALAVAAICALTACDASSSDNNAGSDTEQTSSASSSQTSVKKLSVNTNVSDREQNVPVNRRLKVVVDNGTVSSVTAKSADGSQTIQGDVSGSTWTATSLLEPGTTYTLQADATGGNGASKTTDATFTTRALSLKQQTFPTLALQDGGTYGVGMPIVVTFDLPVTNKAGFERAMKVTTTPAQEGSWNWISDTVAHWRPKDYWQPGTKVSVAVDVNSVPAGGGVYGQKSVSANFTIGDSVISEVNTQTHQMTVKINGKVAKVIPVTTGQPGMASRNGIKVIMEKYRTKDMDGATVGYKPGSADYYNIKDVQYAMRLTNSGEFVHAAPWSTWAQGKQNVSHACVGMTVAYAGWLFNQSHIGDVVQFVGSDRKLEPGNGWTDWNESWDQWKAGSALSSSDAN